MNTYSEMTRASLDDDEVRWRAFKSDIVEFVGHADVDTLAAVNRGMATAYAILRQLQVGGTIVADWITWAGNNAVDPEDGFIHTSGVRNTFVVGAATWYTMNVANANYRTWCAAHVIELLKGEFWGAPPTNVPLDGCLVDVTLWYPAVGDLQGVVGSDEFPTEPANDNHPYMAACVTCFTAVQAAILSEWPSSTPFLYPNFGDVQFLDRGDDNTEALIAASDYILAQVAFNNDAADTAIGVGQVNARLGEIEYVTDNSKNLLCGFVDDDNPTDKGCILAVALFNLVYSDYLFARYAEAAEDDPSRITNWERHDAFRVAHMLGPPTAARTVDGSGRLFSRTFQNGKVYAWIKNVKTDASDGTTISGHTGAKKLNADGSLTDIAGDITLNSNEGLIVLENVQKFTVQFTATDSETMANKAPNQAPHLNLQGPLPGDANLVIANATGQHMQLDAVNSELSGNIRCGIIDCEMRTSGLNISSDPAGDITLDVGDVAVDKKGFNLLTSGVEEKSYRLFGQKLERSDIENIGARIDYREGAAGDDEPDDIQET